MTGAGGSAPVAPLVDLVRRVLSGPEVRILAIGAASAAVLDEAREPSARVVTVEPRRDIRRGTVRLDLRSAAADAPFTGALAVGSLRAVGDLAATVAELARLLEPGGMLVVEDLTWDRVDLAAADWMHAEARRLGHDVPDDPVGWYETWRYAHRHLATSETFEAALTSAFEEVERHGVPYLADAYLDSDDLARRREAERLSDGRLHPVAFRWVGRRA